MIGLNGENILKSVNPKNPNSDNGRHGSVVNFSIIFLATAVLVVGSIR
jgi:hypothetical protein